ncbi:MAG: redox-sensing transcriptional repressor Rex [Actinomycetia bacterium]|nr:redox-sensing transcriptional repressor Rex [Actinomycetes bacterium]
MVSTVPERRGIPDATVARLPEYLRALTALTEAGTASVSSEGLAAQVGVSSAKLRKDLSYLGSYGVRGVGYDVGHLSSQIALALGLSRDWAVAIVGMGNLGRALASYNGFESRGVQVVALLDKDPAVVGSRVAGLTVEAMDDLPAIARDRQVAIALVATPARSAQAVAEALVAAGITSILNFAPLALDVPDDVQVRKVDLATEVQILAFHQQRQRNAAPEPQAATS